MKSHFTKIFLIRFVTLVHFCEQTPIEKKKKVEVEDSSNLLLVHYFEENKIISSRTIINNSPATVADIISGLVIEKEKETDWIRSLFIEVNPILLPLSLR